MILKRLRAEAERQNWFGVAVDLAILILGVFLGIQVNNWNQTRLDRAEGREYRDRLYFDLESDQRDIAFRILERAPGANVTVFDNSSAVSRARSAGSFNASRSSAGTSDNAFAMFLTRLNRTARA